MSAKDQKDRLRILILGFYSAGIIVGGGILALPFVAIDTGSIMLVLLLIAFACVFYVIYTRMLDSISAYLKEISKIKPGLILYDEGLRRSGLRLYGHLAFTLGILLYVIPADIVYILYGLKSLIQLASYISYEQSFLVLMIGIILFALTVVFFVRLRRMIIYKNATSYEFFLKLLLMISLWIITIGILKFVFTNSVVEIILGSLAFTVSLIIGEFFPEKFWKMYISLPINENILPTHKVGAYMSAFKLVLITLTPILAFIIISMRGALSTSMPIFPRTLQSLVAAIAIIVFMYVGSGVYNILVYNWIVSDLKKGRIATLIAILLSLTAYLVFSLTILFSVDASILFMSNMNREHAFIALARKLELIGITQLGFLVIVLANIFALVSVSVAFLGFTDTLSDRLELDLGMSRSPLWVIIAVLVTLIVIGLEVFDVTRIAADALGIAGNAGGGLFILILPWLMKDSKGKRRIGVALMFLILVTVLNIFMILNSITFVAWLSSLIATILVLIFGSLVLIEAIRADKKRT